MKRILLASLLLTGQLAWAACDYKAAGLMAATHVVSPVKSLVETVTQGACRVSFVVKVNSESSLHSVEEMLTDDKVKGSELCRVAIQNGINKLLLKLGEKIDSDNAVFCREGKKIKAGDSIFEGDVGLSKVDLYFKYQNMRCRNFTEQYYDAGTVKKYHGVICQPKANESQWIVMDKW